MKNRKFISIFLCLVLLLSGISCVTVANAENTPTFAISSVSGAPGETVSVTVSTVNNPGITSINGKISYDKSILTLTGVTYSTDFGGTTVAPQNLNVSPVTVNWIRAMGPDCTLNAPFVTLTFKISETASKGSSSTISMTYDADNVYNLNENNVHFDVINGSVTVSGTSALTNATLKGDKITAEPGEEVLYSLSLDGTQSLAGFRVYLDYNTDVFSLDYDTDEDEYVVQMGSGLNGKGTLLGNVTDTGCQALWHNTKNVSVSGNMLSFKLKVADNAEPGDYPVTVRYSTADTLVLNESGKLVPVSFGVSSGNINVSDDSDVNKAEISIKDGEIVTGSTVSLPVTITNNTGFAGFTFVLKLPDGITLESVSKGSLLSNSESGSFLVNKSLGRINWVDTSTTNGEGELFVIKLSVPKNYTVGTYDIGLELLQSNAKNFADINGAAIPLTLNGSELTVLDYILGDVDNDGYITTADAILMAKYIVEAETFDTRQMSAADIDKDGDITAADCIKMSQYLVGIIESFE